MPPTIPYFRVSLSILIICLLLFAAACQKSGSPFTNGGQRANDTSKTTTTLDPGDTAIVYVAGSSGDTVFCWRNGALSRLSSLPDMPLPSNYVYAGYAYTSGITLSDTDVYISGGLLTIDTSIEAQGYTAAYWKNGVPTTLLDSAPAARSFGIAASDGNVLVAGTESYNEPHMFVPYSGSAPFMSYTKYGAIAMSWANGTQSYVSSPYAYSYDENDTGETILPDYVSGIAVSGSDIYLAGGVTSFSVGLSSSMHFTGYWKNGVFVDLPNKFTGTIPTDSTGYFAPKVNAIAVSGSDVYACGTEITELGETGDIYNLIYRATAWNNGVLTYLGATSDYSQAYGVYVSGSDVYVAGVLAPGGSNSHAVYWKNGTAVGVDNTVGSSAQSIFVLGNNIYVVGYSGGQTVYWRNGKVFSLNKSLRTLSGIVARYPSVQ